MLYLYYLENEIAPQTNDRCSPQELADGFQDELLLNKQVKRVRVSLPAKSNARMSTSCAIPASSLALFATKTERVNVNAMLSVTDARI